jgi:glycosyltransferase involved in cell wall biosynthesis
LIDMLQAIVRFRGQYQAACVDVFSGWGFLWAEAAGALLRALKKPIILTLHGGNLPQFSRKHPGRVRRLLASAAAVTCPSSYLCQEMARFREDLVLLPNGLELALYQYRKRQPPLRNLVWLRALHQIYNPEMAVRVLGQLRGGNEDIHLTMVGPDKGDGSMQKAKALAEKLGVAGAIDFRGAVPKENVPGELAQADIFLNTTNFDNTPVSVIEALACGLPVVSTNVGGIPHLLEHGKTALLVEPGNAEGMASAVKRLRHEPELAVKLGQNGRRLAETFDWGIVLPQWESLLAAVVPR